MYDYRCISSICRRFDIYAIIGEECTMDIARMYDGIAYAVGRNVYRKLQVSNRIIFQQ